MADNGQAFEILGTIKVDVPSLVKSLREAEGEVRSSTGRQAKTYEEFANRVVALQRRMRAGQQEMREGTAGGPSAVTGLYKERFGTGAGSGGAMRDPVGAMRNMTAAMQGFHVQGRLVGQLIGHIVPGLGGIERTLRYVVKSFGLMGGAAAAGVAVLAAWYHHASKVADAQWEINKAIATNDTAKLTAQVNEADDVIKRFASGSLIDWWKGLGKVTEAETKRLQSQAAQLEIWRKAENVLARQVLVHKEEADLATKLAQRDLQRASTIKEHSAAEDGLLKATVARQKADDTGFRLAEMKKIEDAKVGLIQRLEMQAELEEKMVLRQKNNSLELLKIEEDGASKRTKWASEEFVRRNKDVASYKERASAVIAADKEILDNKRAMAAAEAAFNGQALEGTKAYLDAKLELTNRELDLEDQAREETFQNEMQRLRKLRETATGDELRQVDENMRDARRANDTAIATMDERRRAKKIADEKTVTEETKKETANRLAVGDRAFQHEIEMGRRTEQDAYNRNRDIANDDKRTGEERMSAKERAYKFEKQLDEKRVQDAKDAVAAQKKIIDDYRAALAENSKLPADQQKGLGLAPAGFSMFASPDAATFGQAGDLRAFMPGYAGRGQVGDISSFMPPKGDPENTQFVRAAELILGAAKKFEEATSSMASTTARRSMLDDPDASAKIGNMDRLENKRGPLE